MQHTLLQLCCCISTAFSPWLISTVSSYGNKQDKQVRYWHGCAICRTNGGTHTHWTRPAIWINTSTFCSFTVIFGTFVVQALKTPNRALQRGLTFCHDFPWRSNGRGLGGVYSEPWAGSDRWMTFEMIHRSSCSCLNGDGRKERIKSATCCRTANRGQQRGHRCDQSDHRWVQSDHRWVNLVSTVISVVQMSRPWAISICADR